MNLPALGAPLDDLDTPCLLVDLDPFERNIAALSAYCRAQGKAWRPHAKCHKSPVIARKLIAAGAVGATCAKLGEAEVLGAAGIRDLLIANPLVGPLKLRRLVALRGSADPIAVVDHPAQVEGLSRAADAGRVTLRVLVEVDVGMRRCGVEPGLAAVALAKQVDAAPGLALAGIMGYEGHLLTVANPKEKEAKIRTALGMLASTKEALAAAGLPCPIVSAGGTGSFEIAARVDGVTEIQAGGGIFMDLLYRNLCQVSQLEFALIVLTTVTSRPAPDRAIIDAGRKTLNMELHMPEVRGRPGIRVRGLSAEHGTLELAPGEDLAVGHRLELIPGYSDFTTVLHDRFFGVRAGRLEAIWPLEARGRLD
jgi:D-serine deaminase-like pyridoxal phosphate-dependent protein